MGVNPAKHTVPLLSVLSRIVISFNSREGVETDSMGYFLDYLKVRYSETDQMGIVYHANYLPWLELGRTEAIRGMGVSYKELEQRGLFVPVLGLQIEYHAPAVYDDHIAILTRLTELGNVRMTFSYEVRRINDETADLQPRGKADAAKLAEHSELLATAVTRHAWLNGERKPVRIDRAAPELIEMFKIWASPQNGF